MHFRGVFENLDDVTDPKAGDVAVIGVKEYVYGGTPAQWKELGDESIYVTKSTTIAGVDLGDNSTRTELLTALNVADGAEVNVIESGDTVDFAVDSDKKLSIASGKQITTTAQVTKLDAIAVDADSVTDGTNKLSFASIPLVGDNSIAKLFE